jgi:hypothetical protein
MQTNIDMKYIDCITFISKIINSDYLFSSNNNNVYNIHMTSLDFRKRVIKHQYDSINAKINDLFSYAKKASFKSSSKDRRAIYKLLKGTDNEIKWQSNKRAYLSSFKNYLVSTQSKSFNVLNKRFNIKSRKIKLGRRKAIKANRGVIPKPYREPRIIKSEYENISKARESFHNLDILDKINRINGDVRNFPVVPEFQNHYMQAILRVYNDNKDKYNTIIGFHHLDGQVHYWTINQDQLDNIRKWLSNDPTVIKNVEGSDVYLDLVFPNIVAMDIILKDKKRGKRIRKTGGFFKYLLNDFDFNLDRFGVFSELINTNYTDNCLYLALLNSDKIDQSKLQSIKIMFKNRQIPKKDLKIVANTLDCCIDLISIRNNGKDNQEYYGDKNSNTYIHLALIDEHYFLYESVNITNFAIEHYDQIKHIKCWYTIKSVNKKGKYIKDKTRSMSSLSLINKLLANKDRFLKEIKLDNDSMGTIYYDKIDKFTDNIEYNADETIDMTKEHKKLYKRYERMIKDISNNDYIFFDIETTTDGYLKPYLCSAVYRRDKISTPYVCKYEHMYDQLEDCFPGFSNENRFIAYYNQYKPMFNEFIYHINNKYKDEDIDVISVIKENYGFLYDSLANHIESYNPVSTKVYSKLSFTGEYCILNFLKSITNNSVIIIHNAGFDFRFLLKYAYNVNMIEKNNSIMSAKCMFSNIDTNQNYKLTIKDSLSLIPMALNSFSSCFKLDTKKEIMPYGIYTSDNINKKNISIVSALKHIHHNDHKAFNDNIDKWGCRVNEHYFDHITYSKRYCEIDCEVLQKGYEMFRQWMLEITNIDIDIKISLPSLAFDYLLNTGCFDGCYKLCGVAREFIQKCVVGGRVMCSRNKAHYHKASNDSEYVDDFDAVSLYPSAMRRMGFLKGKPKVIYGDNNIEDANDNETISYDELKKEDGYFIQIKINHIGKRHDFPLISYINESGIRVFSDDINEIKDKYFYVDKFSLEDFITFHDIQFDIIKGYVFDQGRNYKIMSVIDYLFTQRVIKKNECNPIQSAYKLIMNSSYGKTIMKPITSVNKIFNNEDDLMRYIDNNYNTIKYYTPIGDSGKFKCKCIKPIVNHYSSPHIGSEILSMSKRIMNEVMCLASELNLRIFYQDTDSMHIIRSHIKTLSEAYKSKYDRDLIGKNMGQFHSDFDYKLPNGKSPKDIYSVESYFLAKKTYIDKLEMIDEEGNKHYTHHVRMKGIPRTSIDHLDTNPMNIYIDLYNGKKITFDLLAGGKAKFEFDKQYQIKSKVQFLRELQIMI